MQLQSVKLMGKLQHQCITMEVHLVSTTMGASVKSLCEVQGVNVVDHDIVESQKDEEFKK